MTLRINRQWLLVIITGVFLPIAIALHFTAFNSALMANVLGIKLARSLVNEGQPGPVWLLSPEVLYVAAKNGISNGQAVNGYLTGMYCLFSGEYEQAIGSFSTCSSQNQRADLCRLRLGDAHYLQGNLAVAQRHWLSLSAPNLFLARTAQALESKEIAPARLFKETAEQTLSLHDNTWTGKHPVSVQLQMLSTHLCSIGIEAEENRDLEVAEAAFQAALLANPQSASAAYRLGRLYRQRGDLDIALGLLEVAIETEYISLLKVAYLELGDTYHDLSQFDAAIESYSLALKASPDYDTARLRRAVVYFEMEEWNLAKGDFELLRDSEHELIGSSAQRYLEQIRSRTR